MEKAVSLTRKALTASRVYAKTSLFGVHDDFGWFQIPPLIPPSRQLDARLPDLAAQWT